MTAHRDGGRATRPHRRQGLVADQASLSQSHENTEVGQNPGLTPREFAIKWLEDRAHTQAGPVPEIASVTFIRLPDQHPAKLAAVCRAALAWTRHTDPAQIESDLLDELEIAGWVRRQQLDEQAAEAIRIINTRPNRAELQRRRSQVTRPVEPKPWPPEDPDAA